MAQIEQLGKTPTMEERFANDAKMAILNAQLRGQSQDKDTFVQGLLVGPDGKMSNTKHAWLYDKNTGKPIIYIGPVANEGTNNLAGFNASLSQERLFLSHEKDAVNRANRRFANAGLGTLNFLPDGSSTVNFNNPTRDAKFYDELIRQETQRKVNTGNLPQNRTRTAIDRSVTLTSADKAYFETSKREGGASAYEQIPAEGGTSDGVVYTDPRGFRFPIVRDVSLGITKFYVEDFVGVQRPLDDLIRIGN